MADAEPTEPTPFRGRHTAGQRLVLAINSVIVLLSFAGAAGLLIGKNAGEQAGKVDLGPPATVPAAVDSSTTPVAVTADGGTLPDDAGPPETFPPVDPAAKNFLVTGADNNACIDPASPYAKAFGDRRELGERSDTIMIMRLDPSRNLAAVLSFPRDLWVKIPGQGRGRINGAYKRDDPRRLIETIMNEFEVGVDHFIQIDFSAFKKIVDAVKGVKVPLPYAVLDENTGLNVIAPGCHAFTGEEALAYVRSRHLQYQDANGKWKEDPSSDRGRIARQQDFLRRTLTAAVNEGVLKPKIISSLYESYKDDLVVDKELTIKKMIEFVGVVRHVDAAGIRTYQIEATGKKIGGADVLIANKDSENLQAILDIFRGKAPLASPPEQAFEETTTTAGLPATTTSVKSPTTPTSVPQSTAVTEPTGTVDAAPESNAPPTAIVPDPNVEC